MKLEFFNNTQVLDSTQQFFSSVLDINIAPAAKSEINLVEFLKEHLTDAQLLAKVKDARFVGMINNLSLDGKNEVQDAELALKEPSDDYDMLLVFGIELNENIIPTKTDISRLTKALNRRSSSRPVVLILKYGSHISFSSAERGQYKRSGQQGEKIGRISILRDININLVHDGHERILLQLRINPLKISTFKELYNQWLEVFNVNILNKEFYNELFTWYLWAVRSVSFPNRVDDDTDDTVYNSENVIRLLTRLIFIWFVKEKGLVPEALFNKNQIAETLKAFNPNAEDNSDYYKAILQNLFFATLNTEMPKDGGNRAFIDDKKKNKKTGYTEEYMDHLVFRYKNLFSNPDDCLKLFENIPFLNGGLFECLDRRDPETNIEMRIDGFSSKPSKQPVVPNVLFFGRNDDLDLSDEFEKSNKYKHCKARGIINILNSYKFTIEENTPLEQEIALDPELLGKIFENLLASYNPETRTTARKQTGSYYTPREIVNYMVDESLIAFLKTKLTEKTKAFQQLGNKQTNMFGNEGKVGQLDMHIDLAASKWDKKEEELENKLRQLFAYESEENPFNGDTETTNAIIAHLSECKILDPACGSGAFPMGILHKMVFALGKLDPCNYTWKQAQLEKAQRDKQRAQQFEDETLREVALKSAEEKIAYVEASFGETGHELDYARKLFLIENCIYGVDIQQIAVQISKLRFFISLMVDQRVEDSKPNRNILSLPNLETKFVAANTLIPVDKPQQGSIISMDANVKRVEQELHAIRQRIFFTKKWPDKKKLKKQELEKRKELEKALISSGFPTGSAGQISSWDPFDPLHSAPFFDPEVMFTLEKEKQGGYFDVVIGNPPYVSANNMNLQDRRAIIGTGQYKLLKGKWDIYCAFIVRSMSIYSKSGSLCFIIPYGFLNQPFAEDIRKYIASNQKISEIVDLHENKIFAATVPTCIPIIHNQFKEKYSVRIIESLESEFIMKYNIQIEEYRKAEQNMFRTEDIGISSELLEKIKVIGQPLSTWFYVSTGAEIHGKERYEGDKRISGHSKFEVLSEIKQSGFKPYIEGSAIQKSELGRYCYPKIDYYLDYSKADIMRSPKFPELFDSKKIIIRGSSGLMGILATYDERKLYTPHKITIVISKNDLPETDFSEKNSLKVLLSLLNSKLFAFYYSNKFGGFIDVYPNNLKELPIINPNEKQVKQIEKLVDSILDSRNQEVNCDKEIRALDIIIYKLYSLTYDECKIVDPETEKLISREDYEKMSIEELSEYEIKN
jgi:adenine-specific DNA-methyltransferase